MYGPRLLEYKRYELDLDLNQTFSVSKLDNEMIVPSKSNSNLTQVLFKSDSSLNQV